MTILLIIMIKRFSLDDLGEEKDIITKAQELNGFVSNIETKTVSKKASATV